MDTITILFNILSLILVGLIAYKSNRGDMSLFPEQNRDMKKGIEYLEKEKYIPYE